MVFMTFVDHFADTGKMDLRIASNKRQHEALA
jgi:hypothetical protein